MACYRFAAMETATHQGPPTAGFADHRAVVVAVDHHPWPYFTVTLEVPFANGEQKFANCTPGQFVMTLAEFGLEPYLRRAFSVFDIRTDANTTQIEIFGKVIGLGTEGLARLEPGKEVPLLGPLGQGFTRSASPTVKPSALIAGGIGSAALLLWARALLEQGEAFDFYYGGYAACDLALSERFEELARASGGELICATESGHRGHHGYITEPLEQALAQGRYGALYTCGPEGLMAKVAALGSQYQVPGQAALETEMGCGYGACLGCAVAHQDGRFRLCCKDGPVFALDEVVW